MSGFLTSLVLRGAGIAPPQSALPATIPSIPQPMAFSPGQADGLAELAQETSETGSPNPPEESMRDNVETKSAPKAKTSTEPGTLLHAIPASRSVKATMPASKPPVREQVSVEPQAVAEAVSRAGGEEHPGRLDLASAPSVGSPKEATGLVRVSEPEPAQPKARPQSNRSLAGEPIVITRSTPGREIPIPTPSAPDESEALAVISSFKRSERPGQADRPVEIPKSRRALTESIEETAAVIRPSIVQDHSAGLAVVPHARSAPLPIHVKIGRIEVRGNQVAARPTPTVADRAPVAQGFAEYSKVRSYRNWPA